jgi:hypothetical protein
MLFTNKKLSKMSECLACTEHCDNPIQPCEHYVHIECIIRTGKPICPACTNPIELTPEQTTELEANRERIRRENQEQTEQEDREVARNIAREENGIRRRRQFDAIINRSEVIFEPFRQMPRDELMMALFAFTYAIEQGQGEVTVNRSVFRLYELTQEMRELGIELGIETSEMIDIMNLVTSS